MKDDASIDIKNQVRNHYPFPIAHAYKKTLGYLDNDNNKLKSILQTAETTLQFLTLMALSQLSQDLEQERILISRSLVDSVRKNLMSNPSFGKWKRLLLDILISYTNRKELLIINGLFDFCFRDSSKKKLQLQPVISDVIDPLITLRNDFHHGRLAESRVDAKVTESLLLLNRLMTDCQFLEDFDLVFISQIVFDTTEQQRPYIHDFVQMTGSFSSFDQNRWQSDCSLDQGVILMLNRKLGDYLTCTPFLCFADQIPVQGIQDIYLLNKIQKNKAIYSSIQFGGELQTNQPEWTDGADLFNRLNHFEKHLQKTDQNEEPGFEFEEGEFSEPETDYSPQKASKQHDNEKDLDKARLKKNPFKFLDYFESDDQDIFFGRKQETEELLRKFHQADLLVVHGESGTGKTSLVKAGLIPRLSAETYLAVYVRMLQQPLQAIQKEVVNQLGLEPNPLEESLSDFFKRQSGAINKTIVIILDQFEEFFIRFSKQTRTHFEHELAYLIDNIHIDIKLIISIRADFFHHLTEFESVLPFVFSNQFQLHWLSAVQAKEAITQPFKLAGIEIEESIIIERIISDISRDEKIDSPILQIVCDSLYRYMRDKDLRVIDLSEYDAIGNVKGALDQYLDSSLDLFGKNRQTAKSVLKSMITSDGTKQVISIEDLAARVNSANITIDLNTLLTDYIQRFIRSRLIRVYEIEGVSHYELSHEILFNTIKSWINSTDRELRQLQQLIDSYYQAYLISQALLEKSLLKAIRPHLKQLNFSQEKRTFIAKSNSQIRKDRLKYWGKLIGTTIGILAFFYFIGTREKEPIASSLDHMERSVEKRMWGDALIYFDKLTEKQMNPQRIFIAQQAIQQTFPEIATFKGPLIKKRDKDSGKERTITANPSTISFSKDGKFLASNFFDSGEIVFLWNLQTGKLQQKFGKFINGELSSPFLFSPDGQTLVISQTKEIQFIDIISGKVKRSLKGFEYPWHITQAKDSSMIVTSSADKLSFWDIEEGKVLRKFTAGSNIHCLAINPDGMMIAICNESNAIIVWTTSQKSFGHSQTLSRKYLRGHDKPASSLAFSADSQILASGGKDNTIILWDTKTWEILAFLEGHQKNVSSLAFTHDGKLLASGSWDGTIRIWDIALEETIAILDNSNNPEYWTSSVAFSPDSKLLAATGGNGHVRLWQMNSPLGSNVLDGHQNTIKVIKYDTTGNLLATAGDDNSIKIWDRKSGQLQQQFLGHTDTITAIGFHPRNHFLASASLDKTVRLWDLNSPGGKATILSHQQGVTALAISPDGKSLVSGAKDGTMLFWDIQSQKPVKSIKEHEDEVTHLLFASDQSLLVSASKDKTVRTWDCKKAESLKVLKHYSPVNSVTIDYDNRYLATASGSKVNVWDLAGGSYFTRLYPKRSTYPSVNKVLFSQDGQKLVAVVEKGELVIWDLRTSLFEGSKTDLRTLKSFPDQSGVVFKPIGSISPAFDIDSSSQELAYASKDNRIRFMKIDFELDSVIRDQIASILKTGLSSCDSCEQTTRDLEFFGDNISTFPKDFKRLAEQRLNAARKGAIVWFKDGGASKIIFYENQLIQEQANSIQN